MRASPITRALGGGRSITPRSLGGRGFSPDKAPTETKRLQPLKKALSFRLSSQKKASPQTRRGPHFQTQSIY